MRAPSLAPIAAVDAAVPARVVDALRRQVIALQARRPPARDYHGTHWFALDARPRHLIEQVIVHLRGLVPRGDEMVGAEWWSRATSADAGFPFHFDRDEGVRRRIISPDLASILYLSDAGGPTVILDVAPTKVTAPRAGIAIHPRRGRFGIFPGPLLHGVLPVGPSHWPRITLLVNWWRSVPRMEPAPALRSGRPVVEPWRAGSPRSAPLGAIDPARLMTRAAWRELVQEQARYR